MRTTMLMLATFVAMTAPVGIAQTTLPAIESVTLDEIDGMTSSPVNLPKLLAIIRDGDEPHRKKAAWATWSLMYYKGIGKASSDFVADSLAQAIMTDKCAYVQQYCADAAGALKNDRALDALLSLMKHEDQYVRGEAIEAIYEIKPKGNAKVLAASVDALDDKTQRVRDFAYMAIAAVGGGGAQNVLLGRAARLTEFPFGLVQALIALDTPEARAALLMELKRAPQEGVSSNRSNIMVYFANVADKAMADDLRPFLGDKDWRVRTGAAMYCGNVKDPKAAPRLRELVAGSQTVGWNQDEDNARLHAIEALGKIKDAQAVPVIRKYAQLKEAIDALSAIGTDTAIDAIYDGLADGLEAPRSYWKSGKQIDVFLRHYDAKPLKNENQAAWLLRGMIEEERLKLDAEQAARKQAEFLSKLADKDRFLPQDKKKAESVESSYTFYKKPFVLVIFTYKESGRFVRSTDVLFRLKDGKYVRVGISGGAKS